MAEAAGRGAEARLAACLEETLGSRRGANRVFEILELLQAEDQEIILCAIRTCSRLFGALLTRGELFVGKLPPEEDSVQGNYRAEEKYKMWMRHRYNSCITCLGELMGHEAFQVKETALCTLMKFVELEAKHPLVKNEWSFNFPRELLQVVVEGLIQTDENSSLLISRFQEYMEQDDVRFFVMKAVAENLGKVMPKAKQAPFPIYQKNTFALISSIVMPSEESEIKKFLVKHANQEEWKVSKLKEHRRAFERMWLGFLKYKLPGSLYKKVLVILHDSILPHLNEPTLLMDFLTVAYDVGGAISLLALNGLFVLILQHNLEYPDFYTKLYSLLDPSIFHVKYRARFFRLLDLFLSSSHLPAYLVAAFAKRLSRLALTAPPDGLLIAIPFICNLLRRHPSCLVLIHRPNGPAEMVEDPYKMDEKEPMESRALESSLWEIKTLQNHYHPDVAKAAEEINLPLSQMEQDLSEILELTSFEIFDRDIKKESKEVPLEYQPARGLFGKKDDLFAEYFSLE
ncbi:nucleolar complex protein 4 homolog [Thamnophis elegans]|uniref:nucleolar complex protein 4 homolog n=1 Tax=Thamnophis elegans TaxID=35005 RepID=UPI0013777BE1|nr:nucleolar complex protein 4 homolog [Thamnophis elegans]XP_032085987.1 nucleolar complex protein 4 homolog [Thamnophis elegans]